MIKVVKKSLPKNHPLLLRGKKEIGELMVLFLKNPINVSTFKVKSDIYKSCKGDLIELQNDKCCYCESPHLSATQHGDVEHYRPKKEVRENSAHSGYWWLMYNWDNLFYSCVKCNQPPGKGTQFPLNNESTRAFNPSDDLNDEEYLILNPSKDKLEEHLEWRAEIVKHRTTKGEKTIEVCNLNRSALIEKRGEVYQQNKYIFQALLGVVVCFQKAGVDILNPDDFRDIDEPDIRRLYELWHNSWDQLQRNISPKSPYSAMIQEGFRTSFIL